MVRKMFLLTNSLSLNDFKGKMCYSNIKIEDILDGLKF